MSYELAELKNGLKIITVPMKERESAGVALWVKTGARMENQKLSGVSHILEHMLFKGTKKRTARQIKEQVEGVGGMLNAFTSEEATCYFAKLLAPHFKKAFNVLSDMINNALIEKEELEKERTVILEEIRMYRDLPSHHVHDVLSEIMWPEQALGRPIAGTVESVSALTREEIVDYKKKHYRPQNLVVTVSGPVKHKDVVNLAEDAFSKREGGRESSFEKASVKHEGPKSHFIEKASEQTHFVIGFHGISRFHPDRYKLGVLSMILGGNMSSRLFEEVREKRGLAYEVKSGISLFQDTGAVSISAGVEAAKSPAAVAVVLKELKKLCKEGVGAGELRRAKDYFTSQLYMALEDTLEHLLWAGEKILDGNKLPSREKIKQSIETVTRGDVQAMAKKIFKGQSMYMSLIGPVDSALQKKIKTEFEAGL